MSLKDLSRKEYDSYSANATESELKLGAMQRIADAVELIAKPYNELLQKVQRQSELIAALEARNVRLNNSNIAYRAWITRLKNSLAKQIQQG